MLTRNGVYYGDFAKSPYYVQIENYIFYFSSKLHKNKFLKRIDETNKHISDDLSKKYKMNIFIDDLTAAFILYFDVEKRGYCIKKDGENLCQNPNIILNGEIVILKN